MEIQRLWKNRFIVGIFLVGFCVPLIIIASKDSSLGWLVIITTPLIGSFGQELWKSLNREQINWDYLTRRDKILQMSTVAFGFVLIGLPIKEDLSFVIVFIALVIGFLVNYCAIYFFGSSAAKEKLLWPKI